MITISPDLSALLDWYGAHVIGIPGYDPSAGGVREEDIAEVIAEKVEEGNYAETSVVAVLRLKSGLYAYAQGGCDTTGWDCQSSGDVTLAPTLEALIRLGIPTEARDKLWPGGPPAGNPL